MASGQISDLIHEIALFACLLKPEYTLDLDERDSLFDLLDSTSVAVFGENAPDLNAAVVLALLCGADSGAEAKELCDQMTRILELKQKLGGSEALSIFQRAMLQAEFNWLAANLHELPKPAKLAAAAR